MKASILVCLASMTLAACGGATQSSSVATLPDAPSFDPYARVLFSLDGVSIKSVEAAAADAPATGLWTDVTLAFGLDCMHTIESEALTYRLTADGKAQILFSAFASTQKYPGIVCQAFSEEERKITLPGLFASADVELVNLNAKTVDIPADTIAIGALDQVEVVATRPLCPADTICKVDGTVVTLSFLMNSCVNVLGPVAASAHQDADVKLGRIALAVHAIEFEDKQSTSVRCAQTIETADVTLVNVYGDVDSIDLQVLR